MAGAISEASYFPRTAKASRTFVTILIPSESMNCLNQITGLLRIPYGRTA